MIIDEHRHIGNCEGRGTPTMESILADMGGETKVIRDRFLKEVTNYGQTTHYLYQ